MSAPTAPPAGICALHDVALIREPGGDDMPTTHGRSYCPACQRQLMNALEADEAGA